MIDGRLLGDQLRAMLRSWFQFVDASRVATVTLVASAPAPKIQPGDIPEDRAMAVTDLRADQQFTYTLDPRDSAGNPARLDGVPAWTADPTGIVMLTPSADGLSCLVQGGGLGTTSVTAACDADLDVGEERMILGVGTVVVSAGEAMVVELLPGAVEPKPPA